MTPKTLMMKEIRTFVFEGLRVPVCPITSIKISISGEAALAAGFASTHTTQPMSFDRNVTNAIIMFSKKKARKDTHLIWGLLHVAMHCIALQGCHFCPVELTL